MEGTELTKQEKESKLTDEFDRFTLEKGKAIHSYYIRFSKLMNDINIITLDMAPLQNEPDANEVREMKARFPYPLTLITNTDNPPPSYSSYKSQYNPPMPVTAQQQPYITQPSYEPPAGYQQPPAIYQQPSTRPISPDSGFVVPTFLPMDDPITSLNKAMMFLTTAISSRYPPTNNQLRTSSNTRIQANIQDGRVVVQNVKGRQTQWEGHYTKQCTTKKRAKDSEWFKEKMLLAQKQEARIKINDDQQDFLADGLEASNSDCKELKLNATSILMTEKVDTYDLVVDDAPTASESSWQSCHLLEFLASEQLVSINDTYVDFLSHSNVIFHNPYLDNNENEVVQEMTSLAQNDVAILSLIENMQHEFLVEKNSSLKNNLEVLKQESTKREDKYLNEVLDLQNKKKKLENIVYKIDSEPLIIHDKLVKIVLKQLPKTSKGDVGVHHVEEAYEEDAIPFVTDLRKSLTTFKQDLHKEIFEMKHIFDGMETKVDEFDVSSDVSCLFIDNYAKCESLETDHFNQREKVYNKSSNELSTRFAKLEDYCISLELSLQHNKEKMISQLQEKSIVVDELKQLLAKLKGKSQVTQCETPLNDPRIQKLEDENVSLAFQVSSLVKEREHIKKLRVKLQAKFSKQLVNQKGMSVNTKFAKPSTSGTKLYAVIEKCTKVLEPGLLRIESEPINAYFRNNKVVHQDYLNITKEHIATLQELNEKWAPAMCHRKNNKPRINTSNLSESVVNKTQKHLVKQNTQKTGQTLLPSTGKIVEIVLWYGYSSVAEWDLRKFSDIVAWYAIKDCAQHDKKCSNPTSAISDQTITNLKDQLAGNEVVRVKIPKCMPWLDAYDEPIGDLDTMKDEVDNPNPQSTPQVLPSFEEYTPPVTYP
ncbi:hypothetical protein Tco_1275680 [Tanacetum coccineum]